MDLAATAVAGYDDEDREAAATDNHLPAVDEATQKTRLAYWNDVLKQLDTIPAKELSAENQVNLAVYRPQVENLAADLRFRGYEMRSTATRSSGPASAS